MKQFFFLSLAMLVCAPAKATTREAGTVGYQVVSSGPQQGLSADEAVLEVRFGNSPLIYPMYDVELGGTMQQINIHFTPATTFTVAPGKHLLRIASGVVGVVNDSITIPPGYKTVLAITPPQLNVTDTIGVKIVLCKPVLYFYPEKDLAVDVKLQPHGNFTFTYPAYENGWSGTAHPGGGVTIDGKTYPYLFWEAEQDNVEKLSDLSAGFVVTQEEVVTFLEEKLSEMGFNDTEKADFITYWAPRMVQSEQGFAQFLFNKEYDALATLSVSPDPNEIFRVYILWTPLENGILLLPKAQELPKMSRKGFHVLEWGGSVLPALSISF